MVGSEDPLIRPYKRLARNWLMAEKKGIFGAWEVPNIVLISSQTEIARREIIDRLIRRDWNIGLITSDIREGFQAIHDGYASVLLIEDTEELPASLVLRGQLSDPVALLTPTIVSADNSQADRSLFKRNWNPRNY